MANDANGEAILKIQRFEERYQYRFDELLDENAVPKMVPFPLYHQERQAKRERDLFIAWEDELFSNSQIGANRKLETRAIKRAVQRGQMKDEQGRTRINMRTIAEQTGSSPDTVSRGIKFLQSCGVVADREMKAEIQEGTGERWTRVYVSLDDEKLARPKDIAPPEPRRHGGNRYTCQKCSEGGCKCKGDNVKIRTRRTLICKCCSHEVELDETFRDLSPDQQVASAPFAPNQGGTANQHPLDGEQAGGHLAFSQNAPIWERPQDDQVTDSHDADIVTPPDSDTSPTRKLRPILKPGRGGMPVGCTDPQLAARQNGSSGPRRQNDQDGEKQVASTSNVPSSPRRENGQEEEAQDHRRSGTEVIEKQDAPLGGVCIVYTPLAAHADDPQGSRHSRHPESDGEGIRRTDTPIISSESGISVDDLTLRDATDADACIGGLSGFPSSGLNVSSAIGDNDTSMNPEGIATDPQDASLTDHDGNRDSASGSAETMTSAAELLLALAGPTPEHIQMAQTGKAKYYTFKRRLTLVDTVDHLEGGKARGALCCYPDNKTRGLGWDTDEEDGWQVLQDTMRVLSEHGYLPILEPSPAARGGHAWVIFDDLVDAEAARAHVLSLASALAMYKEYWPGPAGSERRWNKVRLPGGRYTRPGTSAWCQLISVSDGEIATCGAESAVLLLEHQTPAGIVPPDVTPRQIDEQKPEDHFVDADKMVKAQTGDTAPKGQTASPTGTPDAQVDPAWLARYGNTPEGKKLWFAFTPRYIASWYNERHSVDELLPNEANGYGLASWRGERTASVKKRGEGWTDFGASVRRDDGSPDGGDALELQVRLSGAPKPEVLRQAGRELKQVAQTELEGAAHAGQPIPAWLEEITRPAGYRHYARLAEQAGHVEQARSARAKASQIEQAEARANADNPEISGVQTQSSNCHQFDDSCQNCQSVPADVKLTPTHVAGQGKVRFEIAVKDAPSGGLSGFSSGQTTNPCKMPTSGTTSAADANRPGQGSVPANGATVPQMPDPQLPNSVCAVPHSQAMAVEYDLIERYHLKQGEACPKCACELYGDMEGSPYCCRCYPPKGYSRYKEVIDQLYPRKYRL